MINKDSKRDNAGKFLGHNNSYDLFNNINYLLSINNIASNALSRGLDFIDNGDGTVTVVSNITIYTDYAWDYGKNKLIKLNSTDNDGNIVQVKLKKDI